MANRYKLSRLYISKELLTNGTFKLYTEKEHKNEIYVTDILPDVIFVRLNAEDPHKGNITGPNDDKPYLGLFVMTDKDKLDIVRQISWHDDGHHYATGKYNHKVVRMHQLVLWGLDIQKNLEKRYVPHHIGHKFDNRAQRLATRSQILNNQVSMHSRCAEYIQVWIPNSLEDACLIASIDDIISITK